MVVSIDASLPSRAAAIAPGLGVLRRYERSWLPLDLVAGLTVGAMLVPQSMAYAELAGLPPAYGFHAVLGALVVYALFGTSRHLGVGPEPGTAILAATGVGAIAAGDPERYVALMAGLALVVAGTCAIAAVARLGFLASLLSKPVLVGYITGVGLTLLSSQIAGFTGVAIESDRFFPRLAELAGEIGDVHRPTAALGAATLVLMLGLRRLSPRVPGPLIGVVVSTAVVAAFGWADDGIALVGAIPAGLPTPALPAISGDDVIRLLPVAAGIALVGYTDNVLTARSVAARHGYRIEPNRELVALALTNAASGFSQGFPVSSSASRTAVPAALGSRTQVVSLVAATFVVATVLAMRPLLGQIPRPALAAVIIVAAVTIIDLPGYRALWTVSREEAVLAVVAALAVVVSDVLVGVLVAVSLSILVALFHVARPHDAVLGDAPGLDGWVDIDADHGAVTEPGLLVYRFDAPLYFLNIDRFVERVGHVLGENPGQEEWLVLDFEGIGALDATALDGLAHLVEVVRARHIEVVGVARANDDVLAALGRASLTEPGGSLRVFATINSAVRAYRDRHVG